MFRIGLLSLLSILVPAEAGAMDFNQSPFFKSSGLSPQIPYTCATGQLTSISQNTAMAILSEEEDRDDLMDRFAQSSFDSSCPSVGNLEPNLSCSAIAPGGIPNQLVREEMEDRALENLAGIQCQKQKLDSLNGEIGCLTQTADSVEEYVQNVDLKFRNDLQNIQKEIQAVQEEEAQQIHLLNQAERILHGERDSGGNVDPSFPGLVAIEAEMRQTVDVMPEQVALADTRVRDQARDEKMLEEQATFQTAAVAKNCFKGSVVSNSDTVQGEDGEFVPASPYEALVQRYERRFWIKDPSSGIIERSRKSRREGRVAGQKLRNFLDLLFGSGEIPAVVPNPQDTEGLAKFSSQDARFLTQDQIVAAIRSQASAFQVPGLNVEGFLIKRASQCFQQARTQVNAERKLKSKPLGALAHEIQKGRQQNSSANDQLLNRWSDLYGRAMRALTGQALPLDVSACRNAKLETQRNCLMDIQKNMEHLFLGTGANSDVVMLLAHGKDPIKSIEIRANGISGALSKLSATKSNLKDRITNMQQARSEYVQKNNQAAEAMLNQAREVTQPAVDLMNQHLATMSRVMALSLGIPNFEFPKVGSSAGPLTASIDPATGLIRDPGSLRSHILGGSMPDVKNQLAATLTETAKKSKALGADLAKASQAVYAVEDKLDECLGKNAREIVDSIESLTDDFGEKNCAYVDSICERGKQNSFAKLVEDLDESLGQVASDEDVYIPGLNNSTVDRLYSGIDGLCDQADESVFKEQERLEAQKARYRVIKQVAGELAVSTQNGGAPLSVGSFEGLLSEGAVPDPSDLKTQIQGMLGGQGISQLSVQSIERDADAKIASIGKDIEDLPTEKGEQNQSACSTIARNLKKEYKSLEPLTLDRGLASDPGI